MTRDPTAVLAEERMKHSLGITFFTRRFDLNLGEKERNVCQCIPSATLILLQLSCFPPCAPCSREVLPDDDALVAAAAGPFAAAGSVMSVIRILLPNKSLYLSAGKPLLTLIIMS